MACCTKERYMDRGISLQVQRASNNLLGATRVSPGPCSIPKAGIAKRSVRRRKDLRLRLLLRRYFVLAEMDAELVRSIGVLVGH